MTAEWKALEQRTDGGCYINAVKPFRESSRLPPETIQKAFALAYGMTFGEHGEHRGHRSGGSHIRKNGEIFRDAFQGKLAECALYNVLSVRHKDMTRPSFEVWDLGIWDAEDFIIGGKKVSVKSTKGYGNLLLLETTDYDADGRYLPNAESGGGEYDYFVLVRMKPYCEDIMRNSRLLYTEKADYSKLNRLITAETWTYDIPGYMTREDFRSIIRGGYILRRGALLNGKTKMDAENYYVQAGCLRDIKTL